MLRGVATCWLYLTQRFTGIVLGECRVMLNYFHGIIELTGWNKRNGSTNRQPRNHKKPIAGNRRKKPSCNNDSPTKGDSRWTSIADRTLTMPLSRLVEPLRLFHPTRLSQTGISFIQSGVFLIQIIVVLGVAICPSSLSGGIFFNIVTTNPIILPLSSRFMMSNRS